ncbi:MAG: outer membrane beta-barrel protein [Paraprevotella sp.]|nr:outer membrane beta-barrel protein [Paraprevotella sp.]
MKKLLLMVAGAFILGAATVNAQIWGGQLILRGGFASNSFKGDNTRGITMLPSYNVGLDFNHPIIGNVYWNTGVMFGTRGYDVNFSEAKFRAHNLNIPLTAGIKYALTSNIAIDGRIGGFFGVDMAGKFDAEDGDIKIGDKDNYKRCDGGILVGFGVWYKRWNIDYTFKRGFAELFDNGPAGAVNHLIRLGYAF